MDEVIDIDGDHHEGHDHDVFYDANSGDDEFYVLMQSTWATGEADNSFCDANSDCTSLTDTFYDTNSDCTTMADSLFSREITSFSFDHVDNWSIDKTHHGIQPSADRGGPPLTFPASIQSNVDGAEFLSISCNGDQSPSTLGEPKSDLGEPKSDPGEPESTLLPPAMSLHVWSLLSLDFLKKRQVKHKTSLDFLKTRHVKYKMFKHIFAPPRPFLPRLIATPDTHPGEVQQQSASSQVQGEPAIHISGHREKGELPNELYNTLRKVHPHSTLPGMSHFLIHLDIAELRGDRRDDDTPPLINRGEMTNDILADRGDVSINPFEDRGAEDTAHGQRSNWRMTPMDRLCFRTTASTPFQSLIGGLFVWAHVRTHLRHLMES
jgi:hypothetical protein